MIFFISPKQEKPPPPKKKKFVFFNFKKINVFLIRKQTVLDIDFLNYFHLRCSLCILFHLK